ncbi:MAG: general secretion pathway protein GspC [Alteromonadaceae bacterium]|uniref:type II secretion system protein N n=1 Tax=unclassified Marinobacter TaxID=83889 RepID=UPI000C3F1D35|nr:type II secretion system protein N [Marinobacter sp. BGYM27]MAA64031.1 general secretion pathway protein GspC [Alteromonadaceae bacterium]MBH85805.1 general secretion pathway protein GspC [Alteromonadaceae bacterium]MDG5500295.1 type II secretion system protein N [Marinobacter sp. BGYM27]|tara:strand:+ start:26321 stop:26977 length:657 start_codon:yes stop_codon:yes gene_type:complete
MTGIKSRLPLIAAVVLAVAMLMSLGWQVWQFMQNEQQRAFANTNTRTAEETVSVRATAPVELPSVNLFGDPAGNETPEPMSTENLPETNLRLFLRGVLAGEEETVASALIEGSDAHTEVYLIGDELPGNASLKAVHANRVIIERSGKLENLYFPDTDDKSGINLTGNESQPPVRAATPPRPQPQAQPVRSAPAVTSERRDEIRQRLEELRQRLRQNSN